MCTLANDDSNDISPNISRIVNNIGLIREVKNHREQLQLVAAALDRAQRETSSLADTYEDWHVLPPTQRWNPRLPL